MSGKAYCRTDAAKCLAQPRRYGDGLVRWLAARTLLLEDRVSWTRIERDKARAERNGALSQVRALRKKLRQQSQAIDRERQLIP